MFKAYIDDSGMRQPPLYVLAGWTAPVAAWARFSDAWDAALRMSPRIRYFKFDEALNLNGEFNGMSEQSRNEKVGLLLSVLEEFKPLGVETIIPHVVFQQYFGGHADRDVRNPYIPAVYSLIARLLRYNRAKGIDAKTEFVFDYQPGSNQMEFIIKGWEIFKETASDDFRPLLTEHPPTFQDDKTVLPLQAADLHAGWSRRTGRALFDGEGDYIPPWGIKAGSTLRRIGFFWDEKVAEAVYEDMFGFKALKFTYSFGYGVNS